jgi:uncharacterized membrane protein YeaQ/YmgE (transglycosylase-associated protein family)
MQMPLFNLFTLSMFISSQQQSWALTFGGWIVLGLIFGFIGSKIFNLTGYGLGRDCLLGVGGAIIGGLLADMAGRLSGSDIERYSEIVAIFGAAVFVLAYHAVRRRRGLPSMK